MIFIDPGVKACGVAFFDGVLKWAKYIQNTELARDFRFGTVMIEMPRFYPGRQKGDVNDLLDLAAVVGRCEMLAESSTRVYPAAWKGQVPKKVMTARILSCLSPEEASKIEDAGSKTHNVVDAVGIGLWYYKRL